MKTCVCVCVNASFKVYRFYGTYHMLDIVKYEKKRTNNNTLRLYIFIKRYTLTRNTNMVLAHFVTLFKEVLVCKKVREMRFA